MRISAPARQVIFDSAFVSPESDSRPFPSIVAKKDLENPHIRLRHHCHYDVIFRTRRLEASRFGNRNSWAILPRHRSATALFQMLVAVAAAAAAAAGIDVGIDAGIAAAAADIVAAVAGTVVAAAADIVAAAVAAPVGGIELETRMAT